jgi:hypothetical protein
MTHTTPPTDDLTNSQAELGALLYEESLVDTPPTYVPRPSNSVDARYLDACNLSALLHDRTSRVSVRLERVLAREAYDLAASVAKSLAEEVDRLRVLENAIREAHWAWADLTDDPSTFNRHFLDLKLEALGNLVPAIERAIRPVGSVVS